MGKVLVHFQHHLCIEANPDLRGLRARAHDDYRSAFPGNARSPLTYPACWRGRCRARAFTTKLGDVTCGGCREALADAHARWQRDRVDPKRAAFTWSEWPTDEQLTRRAWLVCCRHVGMPSPFSPKLLQELDCELRADAIENLSRLSFGDLLRDVRMQELKREGPMFASLDPFAQYEKLDEDLRFLVRPLLDEYRAICGEIEVRATAAAKRLTEIAETLRPRSLIQIPGSGWAVN